MNAHDSIPPQTLDRWRLAGSRPSAPLVILLHGRGSNEADLQGLHPHLGTEVTLLTPGAPFPGAPWGYGPGWAWYRYLAEDRMVPETLAASLDALDGFMETLPERIGLPTGAPLPPIFLGGFSQGGTTALAWSLTRPGRVLGVLNLSGFLAAVPVVESALAEGAPGLPVFWGHGEADPAIPFALGLRGRERLEAAGARVTRFDHPGGHTITPGEMAAIRTWLNECLAGGV
jgi:phospholipase/carboxylesterase